MLDQLSINWNKYKYTSIYDIDKTTNDVGSLVDQQMKSLDSLTIQNFDSLVKKFPNQSKDYLLSAAKIGLNANTQGIEKLSANLNGAFANKVQVRIKPKRAYSQMHSKKYITKIMEHSRQHQIEILSPNANLYEIISQSDLVIATPWTSPAVLAKELATNSVFFTIRAAEWDLPAEYEGIRVINSCGELTEYVNLGIQKKFKK